MTSWKTTTSHHGALLVIDVATLPPTPPGPSCPKTRTENQRRYRRGRLLFCCLNETTPTASAKISRRGLASRRPPRHPPAQNCLHPSPAPPPRNPENQFRGWGRKNYPVFYRVFLLLLLPPSRRSPVEKKIDVDTGAENSDAGVAAPPPRHLSFDSSSSRRQNPVKLGNDHCQRRNARETIGNNETSRPQAKRET